MSPNELYVLEALKAEFGGDFCGGEDPPDAYLFLEEKKIAVEVTRLVEHVKDKSGKNISRMAHDAPALNLSDDLDKEMQELIPDGKYVFLVIPSPINNVRRTKEKLMSSILNGLQNNTPEQNIEIENNRISINIYGGVRPSGKKVIGAVSNRYSSANIGENSAYLLQDRISSKTKKCIRKPDMDEYWLALFNDYWVADKESYCLAYQKINIEHKFDKIFIINGYGEVHLL